MHKRIFMSRNIDKNSREQFFFIISMYKKIKEILMQSIYMNWLKFDKKIIIYVILSDPEISIFICIVLYV